MSIALNIVILLSTASQGVQGYYKECKNPVQFNVQRTIPDDWRLSDLSKEVQSAQDCAEFCFRYPMCRSARLSLIRSALICQVSYLGIYSCSGTSIYGTVDTTFESPALIACIRCPLEHATDLPRRVLSPSRDISGRPSQENVVVIWNKFLQRLIAQAKLQPPEAARFYAIVHTCIHRAFVAAFNSQKTSSCAVEVIIGAAAHSAIVTLLSTAREEADRLLKETDDNSGCPEEELAGNYLLAFEVSKEYLAERAKDGAFCHADYKVQVDRPDSWRPPSQQRKTPILPCWGNVSLFELGGTADRFVPSGPPLAQTIKYRQDWREIFSLGVNSSRNRLPEQTEAAILWDPPTFLGQFNTIVADVLKLNVEPNDLKFYVKTFWLANVALANTGISIWRTKYTYHNWRPDTAFHTGHAEVPDLPTDVGWEPLLETPVFPDYPSGHSGMGAAVTTVLQAFFGDPQVFSVTDGRITHEFRSLEAAALENAFSRVYGGVHWRNSCDAAIAMGKQIAKAVLIRNAPEIIVNGSPELPRQSQFD